MKIAYKHLLEKIETNPCIDEISNKFFQLGHEHEIENKIFDMELTPNRGDCLSLNGILRDLNLFYKTNISDEIYKHEIKPLKINFKNNVKNKCSKISFLKIEIDELPTKYDSTLESYFEELNITKNNFFTDISNYISYETGQPTHCYDYTKLDNEITLSLIDEDLNFETLIDKTIRLSKGDMVFLSKDNKPINLAGIIGGKKTSCNQNTNTVLVECAYFDPEVIIGKATKYAINSDAAYKFERNTDANCHDYALRRFLKIVENNAKIKNVEIYSEDHLNVKERKIKIEVDNVNKVLGTKISKKEFDYLLERLGFNVESKFIQIPSYRNDVKTINDVSEEIARAIGYNNIKPKSFNITLNNKIDKDSNETNIVNYLIDNGFSEVINNPFVCEQTSDSIKVDNPLDSNRKFLRTSLKESLINNLLYNERRQQESLKFFETADLYTTSHENNKRVLGIIASGRVDKNYIDFSKMIDEDYLISMLSKYIQSLNVTTIPRETVKSKSKNAIVYAEIELIEIKDCDYISKSPKINIDEKFYSRISEFPSSSRDLSFSISDPKKLHILEDYILNLSHELLKEVYIFDYYNNTKTNVVKIGVRFIFQSKESTITDNEVNRIINNIIKNAISIDSVTIPGLT